MSDAIGFGLPARFLRGLAKAPRNAALRVDAKAVSYEEVHELALRWAGAMLAGTSARPKAVGVLAGKGVESYVGILAALYAGATVVPLSVDFPADRTRRMLEISGTSMVVADERGLAVLGALSDAGLDVPALAPGQNGGDDGRMTRIPLGQRAGLHEPVPVAASDVAYVLFTSGSTGRPKGVPITHGMVHHYFQHADARYDFTESDVFSQTFDVNFDCAMFDMFCAWGAGATVQTIPAAAYRKLPEFLAETGMSVWFSVPSTISLIRRMGGLAPGGMPTLRWSLFAGEALRADDAAAWQAAAPGSTVENIYGPTELTVTITGHRWSPEVSPGSCVNGLVPIGSIHEGHEYLLIGPDGAVADREGELCVTGPQMTAGYLDPSDDEGRFLERGGRRWYRTGDRVRLLGDGELVYLGRLDSQVQLNGWRVELAEIEHAVRGCAGVQDAVAVVRTGGDGPRITVFYTGAPSSPAELARQLRRILPAGMMPKQFQHVDEFPLNANRKIDRARLAAAAAPASG
ncbi:AMP-binding protein [Actinomadura opuntiae]|uniref:AMP-binding protein n=1 Tax=Actinomadura sp. OS1-43 TaxID=604315 RepID=UPI00255B386E|nr:AMP-binding protein [Actinomadura sp. OS1-43]MDL4817264.1 AMP-binding protein [Actinomadura sp. OS1-43]